ncbi:hypothetical protein LDENG_00259900 [Lucifuga dentata]|nr:hypothetical protein LDENG_00259900 [Lucifuga dentata]
MNTKKREHISPIPKTLHWLPVKFRIDFKALLIVYKSLNGLGQKYIADMFVDCMPGRSLRSAGTGQLSLTRTHTHTHTHTSHNIITPKLWNDLPEDLRLAKSVSAFKSQFKTHFYRLAFM